MSSIPYSRYIVYPVPWYSFLIVLGAALAVFLGSREERRAALPKDTVIDLAVRVLPIGIIGARIYYVVFAWNQFRDHPLSILKIWEGGIAIYGGLIAGIAVIIVFCRKRHLSVLKLCDLIAPGLALAQCIGRWGNYFNIEAYGLTLHNPDLCFFPLAVEVPLSGGSEWHMATFFYESFWDFMIFVFLVLFRHTILRRQGDVFFFYLFLYASGRLMIEDLRSDSLYASSVRVSQLLSVLLCISVMVYYLIRSQSHRTKPRPLFFLLTSPFFLFSLAVLYNCVSGGLIPADVPAVRLLFLFLYVLTAVVTLLILYHHIRQEACHADDTI